MFKPKTKELNKSKEFRELQNQWYDKLKVDGFVDAENEYGEVISGAEHNVRTSHTVFSYEVKYEYYRLAGHFLHDHSFENDFDEKVWKAHSEGRTIREIEKDLDTYRFKVNKSVLKTKKLMLKKYMEQNRD